MGKIHTLRLDSYDVGQILDGLRCRLESWRETTAYLESGHIARDAFIVEECGDAEEARAIADHYERIISSIEHQLR
jgi:hypothetical protein